MANLGTTELDVFRLCLGGNVFGWTADETDSFAVLDAYAAAGGNFIDTADTYMRPNMGVSETIIGRWMAARGNRDDIVLATKVGSDGGLSAGNIREHAEASLRRLQTDRIDLYYAHKDDLDTPVAETLRAFDELVREGKVRHIAASNLSAERLRESLDVSWREGLAEYVALQPHYNLVEREGYEREYAPVVEEHNLACLPYYALAKGFLTGKYRPGGPDVESPRSKGALAYLDGRGERVLAALDQVAAERAAPVAAVALAWLSAQPGVVSPIASARSVEQLEALLPAVGLKLTDEELATLTEASA
ncbi:aldo/keto reductase [Candidatus Solirubrobacter pratensis]|uniref:aldo/keto reductase n=1 Tax=Candidatus Solirubrobacter pratensis TaxID=1298857 RepID=UPI0004128372|nr:aldo/keto reductase [Candidatus Solirubrobacter pratensis]